MQFVFLFAAIISLANPSKREPKNAWDFCSETSYQMSDGVLAPIYKTTQTFSADGKERRLQTSNVNEGAFQLSHAANISNDGRLLRSESYSNGKVSHYQAMHYENASDPFEITAIESGVKDRKLYRLKKEVNQDGRLVRSSYVSDSGEFNFTTFYALMADGSSQTTELYTEQFPWVGVTYTSADKLYEKVTHLESGRVSLEQTSRFFANGEASEEDLSYHTSDSTYRNIRRWDEDHNLVSYEVWTDSKIESAYSYSNEFEWDSSGRMIYRYETAKDLHSGEVLATSTIAFSYDSQGRLIERSVEKASSHSSETENSRTVWTYDGCGKPGVSAENRRSMNSSFRLRLR